MSANQENGGSATPTPNASVVEALREELARAERGELQAVAIVGTTPRGTMQLNWAGDSIRRDSPVLLLGLRRLEAVILGWWE